MAGVKQGAQHWHAWEQTPAGKVVIATREKRSDVEVYVRQHVMKSQAQGHLWRGNVRASYHSVIDDQPHAITIEVCEGRVLQCKLKR